MVYYNRIATKILPGDLIILIPGGDIRIVRDGESLTFEDGQPAKYPATCFDCMKDSAGLVTTDAEVPKDGPFYREDVQGYLVTETVRAVEKIVTLRNDFESSVTLGKKIAIKDAVSNLAYYHDVAQENILKAFSNLRIHLDTEGVTIVYSAHPDEVCLVMVISDASGNRLGTQVLNKYDGQPVCHVH